MKWNRKQGPPVLPARKTPFKIAPFFPYLMEALPPDLSRNSIRSRLLEQTQAILRPPNATAGLGEATIIKRAVRAAFSASSMSSIS